MSRVMILAIGGLLVTASVACAAELTADDQLYIKKNEIYVPRNMSPSQTTGLHNAINDPKTKTNAQSRLKSVNDYLDKVAAHNLYCIMNPNNADCRK